MLLQKLQGWLLLVHLTGWLCHRQVFEPFACCLMRRCHQAGCCSSLLFHRQAFGLVEHAAARCTQRGAVPHRHESIWSQLRLGRLLHQQLGGLVQGFVRQAAGQRPRTARNTWIEISGACTTHREMCGSRVPSPNKPGPRHMKSLRRARGQGRAGVGSRLTRRWPGGMRCSAAP